MNIHVAPFLTSFRFLPKPKQGLAGVPPPMPFCFISLLFTNYLVVLFPISPTRGRTPWSGLNTTGDGVVWSQGPRCMAVVLIRGSGLQDSRLGGQDYCGRPLRKSPVLLSSHDP